MQDKQEKLSEKSEIKTGEILIGATVVIQGTKSGAATDFEGDYIIGNVMPELTL